MSDIEGKTGGRLLVEALVARGVDHVFCVPGESYLAVLDALVDEPGIRVVTCRHESGAANMAEAYGKLTGKPGICMVTRGPGATNAAIGVHTAQQDSTPMILFVGQIGRGDRGRGAFQEVDYRAALGDLAKWSVELDDASRTDEILGRAFATALQGRRGPVIIALPEDMLTEVARPQGFHPTPPCSTGLDPATAASIHAALDQATKPLLLLGGSGWSDEALKRLEKWADAAELPVLLSFRRKDLWDNEHRCYIGDIGLGTNPKLLERVREADLILAIGARLGENVTQGYTLFRREDMARKLIHILADPAELGRVWPPLIASATDVAAAALKLAETPLRGRWPQWRSAGRADYEAFSSPVAVTGQVNLSQIFAGLGAHMPADTIICNGAGNYAAWLHRFHRHRRPHTQLAPTSGAMGYGVPAAVAAKLVHPDREVICVSGDGCFLMTGQEIATAVQHDARVIFIVVDNGSYGTIRMHQEKEYPGRVIATNLRNPDFAAYARAFGAWAIAVESTEAFEPALAQARACGTVALIHVKTSVQDIAPGRTLPAAESQ
ncbi:thiamine pyrophosphate-binding protein [Sphingobium sp. LB126]|uniref:thiamine pyrophosphate-binding protein n=1 Tax=Sphingobium sp. LB126 TaxID=1983755 RepID=UPI000C20FCF5|nr:thiamine pyrophosphate-binding protein [Sphingobium sp. LB126]PJG48158.1 thiamine pyrophosphate-binding protein [Sphingobium sp. LB126]